MDNMLAECPKCLSVRLVREWESYTKQMRGCTGLVPLGKVEGLGYVCPYCENIVLAEEITILF